MSDNVLSASRSSYHCLQDRSLGRLSPWDFCSYILHENSDVKASQERWNVSLHTQIRPASRSSTTALDLCTTGSGSAITGTNQFLLSGSKDGLVSIYDLWETKPSDDGRCGRASTGTGTGTPSISYHHRPIQQAQASSFGSTPTSTSTTNLATGGSGSGSTLAAVQWYPIDPGIFLTASASGTVALWDTAAMVPLLNIQPFQFSESRGRYTLRCMHVSSFNGVLAATGSNESATIKLVDLQSGAASHTLTPQGKSGHGVTAVKWSPIHSYVLASCGGGRNVHLWDIRRSAQPLATLDAEYRSYDRSVSKAIPLHRPHWLPQKESALDPISASNVAFTETGQHLVSVCGISREIYVWDLFVSDAPVCRQQTFTNANGGTPLVRGQVQPLLLTSTPTSRRRQEQSTLIWVGNAQHGLDAYDLLTDTSVGSVSKPVATLRGHLGPVHTAVAIRAPCHLISAADDGLILVWDRRMGLSRHLQPGGDLNATGGSNQRHGLKRRMHDVDFW